MVDWYLREGMTRNTKKVSIWQVGYILNLYTAYLLTNHSCHIFFIYIFFIQIRIKHWHFTRQFQCTPNSPFSKGHWHIYNEPCAYGTPYRSTWHGPTTENMLRCMDHITNEGTNGIYGKYKRITKFFFPYSYAATGGRHSQLFHVALRQNKNKNPKRKRKKKK